MAKTERFRQILEGSMSTKAAFPKRKSDGSFCIEVSFPVITNDCEDLLRRVKLWAGDWMTTNTVWKRKWDPSGREETLYYDEEFKTEPNPVSCTSNELKIRLEGQPSSKWWRDWLVSRIIHDLRQRFNEVQSGGSLKDCD